MVPFLSLLKQAASSFLQQVGRRAGKQPIGTRKHTYIGRLLEGKPHSTHIIPWTASMPSLLTLFLGLATLLFGVFVTRSPFMMTTAPVSGSKPWADQPMKLVATPQYETKKVSMPPSLSSLFSSTCPPEATATRLLTPPATRIADRPLQYWRNAYGAVAQFHLQRLQQHLPASTTRARRGQGRLHRLRIDLV